MPGRRDVFEQALRQGHLAAWDQQWERAIAAYRKAIEEFPEDANALSSLGLALLQGESLDAALVVYERASQVAPGDPVPLEQSANILERLGRFEEASPQYMAVAEIHLARRDVDKAIENWARASRLTPDLLLAHQRLALAYERTGKRGPATAAYLAAARLLQSTGDNDKAMQAAERARALEPRNADVLRAIELLRQGSLLPRMPRPGGATDALRATRPAFVSPDPLAVGEAAATVTAERSGSAIEDGRGESGPSDAACQRALAALATYMFGEVADQDRAEGLSTSAPAASADAHRLPTTPAGRELIITQLGQAIDAHRRGDAPAAVAAYEQAIGAGLAHPAAHLCLGLLYQEIAAGTGSPAPNKAEPHFLAAVAHPDYRTGANFALAQLYRAEGKAGAAVGPLLEVLRDVDMQTVPPERAEDLGQLYETIIEGLARSDDTAQAAALVENLAGFLSGPGWWQRILAARRQLDAAGDREDGTIAPLAEMLSMPGTEQVLESLRLIDQYVEKGYLASAMDEAHRAIEFAPTYLPVHLRLASMLSAENRLPAAIEKYAVVAEAYEVRGEIPRASRILEQVVRLAPMDQNIRTRLIDLLTLQNRDDEALGQYMDLAEIYYRMVDLDSARKTFADALRLAQRSGSERVWSVKILHAMGDIDLQRLDWRQALRVYQQIKTLAPSDEKARAILIDLKFRLGQRYQALTEVDDLLRYRLQEGQVDQAITFLEESVRQRSDETGLRTRLARFYQERGRKVEAITQLDAVGEIQLKAGQSTEAAATVRAILALDPPPGAAEGYRQLLTQLEGRPAAG